MSDTFDGFIPPTKNFFHMPNEWINICARITNLAELKVVQYVLRHTWGYREYDGKPKPITVDEFMNGRKKADGARIDDGTGLSKPSVIQGLKYAIKNGYLVCEIDDTDKARVIKSYALKMSDASEVKILNPQEGNRGKDPLPQGSRSFTTGVKDLDINGKDPLPRSEKDTSERHFGKKEGTAPQEDDSTQMGTPSSSPSLTSLSQVEHLSTTDVDKRANGVDTTQLPIATVTTRNASTTPNARNTEPLLSAEGRQVRDYWSQLGFESTSASNGHWNTLSKHIASFEQMDSLFKYARAQLVEAKDPTVHPGNMVKAVNGWKQKQTPPEQPKQETGKPYKSNAVEDYNKMVEEVQTRIAAERKAKAVAQQQAGARK